MKNICPASVAVFISVLLTTAAISSRALADSAVDKARIRVTITQLSDQIQKEPKRSMLYAKRGQCYADLQDWNNALRDTNVALNIKPSYSPYYAARAEIYKLMGKSALEIVDLQRAVELDPKNVQALRGLAVIYGLNNRFSESVSLLSKALETEPTTELYLLRAEGFVNLKDYQNARTDCEKVLAIDPQNQKVKVVLHEISVVQNRAK